MSLETATYINGLVSTNPTATDNKSEGDDHIRLLKSTIQATFPSITGAVTATHTELNYVDGVTSAIQTQLDSKAPLASPTFTGTVTAPTFSGALSGNATTATSVSNGLTFSNAGSGAASGTTYNGSVARTISYNSIGAAASSHTHTMENVTDLPTLASGTWTPTSYAVSNTSFRAVSGGRYSRVGNIVTCSTIVTVQLTSAPGSFEIGMSLPVASNFTSMTEATGVAVTGTSSGYSGYVFSENTNDRLHLVGYCGSGTITFYVTAQYQVI